MDIDKYETLVEKGDAVANAETTKATSELSYFENEYSAPFKSSNTKNEQRNSLSQSEPQNDWHAAGDILDNLHPEFMDDADTEEIQDEPLFDESEMELEEGYLTDEEPHFESQEPEQPIEYDPVMQEPSPIPMVDAKDEETKDVFNEEPLQEEPIFFEEPLA